MNAIAPHTSCRYVVMHVDNRRDIHEVWAVHALIVREQDWGGIEADRLLVSYAMTEGRGRPVIIKADRALSMHPTLKTAWEAAKRLDEYERGRNDSASTADADV